MDFDKLLQFQKEETDRIIQEEICIMCFGSVSVNKLSKKEKKDYFEFLLCPDCMSFVESQQ